MTPDRWSQEYWQLNDGDATPPRGRSPLRGVTVASAHRSFGKAAMLTVQDVLDSHRPISRFLHNPPGRVHRRHPGDRPPRGTIAIHAQVPALPSPSRHAMTEPSTPKIPDELRPYLDTIADRLLSGHAAVMVGSGFSTNAAPPGSGPGFPDWSRLGESPLREASRPPAGTQ